MDVIESQETAVGPFAVGKDREDTISQGLPPLKVRRLKRSLPYLERVATGWSLFDIDGPPIAVIS